jgi:hypothetical protein
MADVRENAAENAKANAIQDLTTETQRTQRNTKDYIQLKPQISLAH